LSDQLGRDETSERALQLVRGKAGDGVQQRIRKLASNRCADLRHMPHRGQAVEPPSNEACKVVGIAKGSSELSRTQRSASSRNNPLSRTLRVNSSMNSGTPSVWSANLGYHLVGQRLAAGDLLGQYGAVVPVEAIERQCADLLLALPGRLELGAERHNQQYPEEPMVCTTLRWRGVDSNHQYRVTPPRFRQGVKSAPLASHQPKGSTNGKPTPRVVAGAKISH